MATGAIGGRHHVGVEAGWFPIGKAALVASDAVQCGCNVGGIFAGCIVAVVATRTVGGCSECAVVHTTRRQPSRSLVTGVTGHRGDNVVRRLARCNSTVVTRGAGAYCHSIVAELGIGEILCGVTSVTSCHRRQMLNGFYDVVARQAKATGVTTGAIFWCTFKYAIDVTAFATGIGMHTGECKASFQVVKILAAGLGHGRSGKQSEDQRHTTLNDQAKNSVNTACHGVTPWRFCN